ncbi:hypothetical protein JAAARDRAFT_118507 [Jaapia argillacea MUCL 33604]|uniref:Uncharacterized protein n=1 Tax=Jaapia argillacea MUCL 33604 TaxID=933084 RepID=A0A067QCC6_9AGAM|nr:hypothetical protein JAAARDRAFT_118507 [Jaapia argillacea MUCL 33604]
MPFHARSLHYLRISATTVLPLYLYLDERHIDWMSDRVLQHVLADLRPLIVPKLRAELQAQLESKKGTVDVHRGDFYQFAFFFRQTEPHAVLIKTRNFTLAPNPPLKKTPVVPKDTAKAKRKARPMAQSKGAMGAARKKRKTKGKGKATGSDGEDSAVSTDDGEVQPSSLSNAAAPRRSGRTRKVVAGSYREDGGDSNSDVEMMDDTPSRPALIDDTIKEEIQDVQIIDTHNKELPIDLRSPSPEPAPPISELDMAADEEEPKPKPLLQLKYEGFTIHGQCLCIVVEPYPPVRTASRAPSLAPSGLRAPSIAPPDFVPSGGAASEQRARTPLFLPDYDRERSQTPAPFLHQERVLPPVPLFDDAESLYAMDDGEEQDDLMEFSQLLNSGGDLRTGDADDDDIDGSVLFGDADENKEL